MSFIKENLVTEGGGVKGIALFGAIQCLHDHQLLDNFTRFAGSSAGAIMAMALACHFSMDTLRKVIVDTNFSDLKDDDWGIARDLYHVFHDYGYYKGDALHAWIEGLLTEETKVEHITFKQVHQIYGTELVITGTNVSTGMTEYYHHSTHADMRVSDAVRISISIPYFFRAVKRLRINGVEGNDEYDILVDGGVLNNYPIWVFREDGELCTSRSQACHNSKTLGLKLMDTAESPDDQLFHNRHVITSFREYTLALMNTILSEVERAHIDDGYWENTVCIPTCGVSTTDFDLTPEKKQELIDSGYTAMENHLKPAL